MIRFVRWAESALLYRVLAHLDLGRDAASIYDPALPRHAWADALTVAYRAASSRLVVQGLGLREHRDLAASLVLYRPPVLDDARGRALASTLVRALRDEGARYRPTYGTAPAKLLDALARLRAGLWERVGVAPPLLIVDCPALGSAGRGGGDGSARVVAVSLSRSPAHILCQVLHEEVHAVTDPVVHQRWSTRSITRDTREGADGFAYHRELEVAAIEVGAALVQARAPEWSDAYNQWCARYSLD